MDELERKFERETTHQIIRMWFQFHLLPKPQETGQLGGTQRRGRLQSVSLEDVDK
jgi:hypothetical protein